MLKTKSSQYEKALLMTRRYRGKAAELLWDSELINKKWNAKGKLTPDPLKRKLATIYSSSTEEDDQLSTLQSKIKKNLALQFLIHEELHSNSSDESFDWGNISAESKMIPFNPVKTSSIIQRKLNAETPSQKAEDQRSITSWENKVSSSKQDHAEVED